MEDTYRNIFKWGDPAHEEILGKEMLKLVQHVFNLSDSDIKKRHLPGYEEVELKKKSRLSQSDLKSLQKIVGTENVSTDDFNRAYHSCGKSYLNLMKLRLGIIDSPPDAVIYPRDETDIIKIIKLCNGKGIPVIPFGGRSSVTRSVETNRGGISLDLTRHMKKVLKVNEINSTVTTQPGIYGPDFEDYLNDYNTGYTCGHFPQSFEFSTVGGWVACRGAGQASTGYGKIEDIVVSMRMVTPMGRVETTDYPAAALGPDIDQVLIGSEGCFGVITEVTLKMWRDLPKNTVLSSFVFKDFSSALSAMREVMQGQFGMPALFRISDPEETDIAFKMKGKEGTFVDKMLRFLGFKPMKRCLMFITVEGDFHYTRLVKRKIKATARRNGGFYTGMSTTGKWLEQRFSSCYLRDPLMDLGIMTDTLETAVTWENLERLWSAVRGYIKKRPDTLCMTHISHCYENGANLYFTFLSPMKIGSEVDDYLNFHKGIIDAIKANKGSLSHHHGIGRMFAPWMEMELGKTGLGMIQAVKDYFDPKGIMNPGKTLGLKK